MNILYLFPAVIDPTRGGIQRNTATQANYLETLGHKTYYLAARPVKDWQPDARRQFYLPVLSEDGDYCVPKNVEFFKNFLKEHRIDMVINQKGVGKAICRLAYHCQSVGVKLLSVIRNSIMAPVVNAQYTQYATLKKYGLGFSAPLLSLGISQKILLAFHKWRWREHYKGLCANSDRVILLSEQFKHEIAEYVGQCPSNVIAISNPYPFTATGMVDPASKVKEILFVGRFDTTQKRADLAVRIWSKLYREFPDWTFRMLGNGPEFDNVVALAKKLKVERVIFEGFKRADEFYKKASLLMMTSAYEGFGMALVEAQGAGCVPLAFQSYASVVDIIDDGKNGVLVKPFDCDLYAEKLANLMRDDALRRTMAVNAVEKAGEFATEKIYGKWLAVFDDLLSQAKIK